MTAKGTTSLFFNIKYSKHSGSDYIETYKEAYILFNGDTRFSEVLRFQSDCKKVFKEILFCKKELLSYRVKLSRYQSDEDGVSINSDHWYSDQTVDSSDDLDGVYFRPDTKYTAENRDLYLTKAKLLEDLCDAFG